MILGILMQYVQESAEKKDKTINEWLKNNTALNYTIIRPGSLTNDEPTNQIAISTGKGDAGKISRADVATVVSEVLANEQIGNKIFNVITGNQAVNDAINNF